ncbi:MAG: ATP synthase F0 subunit C [Lachnospiraceae bacterium]|nr:ATP synthase F0 subunit C [Lachnospiraceae bacterium]
MGTITAAEAIKAKAADASAPVAMQAPEAPEGAEAVAAAGDTTTGTKAIAAAIAIGLAAIGGTFSMGMSIAKSNEGVARQPEAAGKIQTQLMLGLVFIETVVIYALIVAILIVFVL